MLISKTFTFDAAHHLNGLAEGHPCARVHGHTYKVELLVEGPVDDKGFVCDYADIAKLWQPLHELLDHRNLNEVEGLSQPSTENLAHWILARLRMTSEDRFLNVRKVGAYKAYARVVKVRVFESSTTYAEASL